MTQVRLRKVSIFSLLLLVLWFVFFEWNFVPYPVTGSQNVRPKICYSPNHKYYIKWYRTPFEAFMFNLKPKGVAILYDKTGKELHRGYAQFYNGPEWVSDYSGQVGLYSVGFDCGANEEKKWWWHTNLPSSPGVYSLYSSNKPLPDARIDSDNGCFDEVNYYLFPQYYQGNLVYPADKLIIKAVEPLEKTEAPFQLQFLIQKQNGDPVIELYFMIIRADGSREHGKTDKNGRTFVIESTQDENITFYFSPYQSQWGFMLPEELMEWCARSPNECSRLEDHTFTANTIQVRVVR